MNDRDVVEPRVSPAQRRLERDVDLHASTRAVAKPQSLLHRLGRRGALGQQAPVELRRRGVGDHRAARPDLLAVRYDANRLPAAGQDSLDLDTGSHLAPVVADQPLKGAHEVDGAAADDRHADGVQRPCDREHLKAAPGAVGGDPGMQRPGRIQIGHLASLKARLEPGARRGEHV